MANLAKGFHDERYRTIITQLVEARKQQGLTQRELAEKLGQHQQFVSRYEIGERRLDVIEFRDVAVALEMNPGRMLDTVRD